MLAVLKKKNKPQGKKKVILTAGKLEEMRH